MNLMSSVIPQVVVIDVLSCLGCLIGNSGNNATLLGAGIDTLLSSGCLSGNSGNNGTFLVLHVKCRVFSPPQS